MTTKGRQVVALAIGGLAVVAGVGLWLFRAPARATAPPSSPAAESASAAAIGSAAPEAPQPERVVAEQALPTVAGSYADVRAPGIPTLKIRGGEVFLDNTSVARLDPFWLEKDAKARHRRSSPSAAEAWRSTPTWRPVRALQRLTRDLRDRRNLWAAAHTGAKLFPGQAQLHIDADAPAIVVKAVLQALSAAGYPNPLFAVQSAHAHPPATSYLPVRVLSLCQGLEPPAAGCTAVSGSIPSATLQSIVRARVPQFKACYAEAREHNPDLRGSVNVRFVIDVHGEVIDARAVDGTTLRDPGVVECILRHYRELSFPSPGDGPVTAVFPLHFVP